MTIRYNTTRGDLLHGHFRTLIRNPILLMFLAVFVVLVGYSAFEDPEMAALSFGYRAAFIACTIVFNSVLLIAVTFVGITGMILLRKNKGVLGEHRLTVSDEGLIESTVHNQSLNRWSAYHRTISTKRHLLMCVTEGQFYIVSKRRPLIEGDLAAFERELNERTKPA